MLKFPVPVFTDIITLSSSPVSSSFWQNLIFLGQFLYLALTWRIFFSRGTSPPPTPLPTKYRNKIVSKCMCISKQACGCTISGKENASEILDLGWIFSVPHRLLCTATNKTMSTSCSGLATASLWIFGLLYPQIAISAVLRIQNLTLLLM